MNETSQILLGFNLMKAAVIGGHDPSAAWLEALEISNCTTNPTPHIWGGAMTCLIFCTDALNKAGLLEGIGVPAEYESFIHAANPGDRLKAVTAATQANDSERIGYLGSLMAACVGARQSCITFDGWAPTVNSAS